MKQLKGLKIQDLYRGTADIAVTDHKYIDHIYQTPFLIFLIILFIYPSGVDYAQFVHGLCPEIRTEYYSQEQGYQQGFANSNILIFTEDIVETAVNEEILEQSVQDVNADGISAQFCKESFSSGAECK